MFSTVIWATDGSEAADRALPYAKALVDGPGRTLVVVHCKELLTGRAGGYPVLADEGELQEKIRRQWTSSVSKVSTRPSRSSPPQEPTDRT
jgi:nucleotide-binding universal stress UspA family protein